MSLTDKRLRNNWVQGRYDALMAEGKHGHYETMFRVVREAVEAEREACAQVLENGRFLHDQAPTKLFATEAAAAIRRRTAATS